MKRQWQWGLEDLFNLVAHYRNRSWAEERDIRIWGPREVFVEESEAALRYDAAVIAFIGAGAFTNLIPNEETQ